MIWLIIGISLFISGCPFKSGVEGKAWFQYASKYVQAWRKMEANKDSLRDFNRMYKMGQKFLQAKQPTEDEIISVLRSQDKRFQIVGLAAMSLKPIETDQLTDILFEFLKDQDPEFSWYARISLLKFAKFPESMKADLGKQFLEIIKNKDANKFHKKVLHIFSVHTEFLLCVGVNILLSYESSN